MKKLLLVMLVPVLVLGFLSCGKVLDAELMPYELQGAWKSTGNVVLVLSGNEATVYDSTNALTTAAFRVEVTPTTVPADTRIIEQGTIKFVGFVDKKKKEIASVSFNFDNTTPSSPSLVLYNLKRADDAVSVLLPTAFDDNGDKGATEKTGSPVTKAASTYTKLSS
jgi:hypothetical protein